MGGTNKSDGCVDATRLTLNDAIMPVLEFLSARVSEIQGVLERTFDECGGSEDGLDFAEFKSVLEVLNAGIDDRFAMKLFKNMNKEDKDGNMDAILSSEAFATICIRFNVYPNCEVTELFANKPLQMKEALAKAGMRRGKRSSVSVKERARLYPG